MEDTDGDGQMDASKIYIDSLILPRSLALVPGGALVVENEALWLTQDLDGDLQADTKTLFDSAYAGGPSPEHSGNGLWRNTDNWYYNAKSRFRYHLKDGKWLRDSTEFRGNGALATMIRAGSITITIGHNFMPTLFRRIISPEIKTILLPQG